MNSMVDVCKETENVCFSPTTWVHHQFCGEIRVAPLFSVVCFCFYFVCLPSVSCVYCCPCLWIVHYWLLPPFSLVFIDNEVRNTLSIILLKKIRNRKVHLGYFRYMNRYKHTNSASTTETKKRTVFTFVFILQIHPIRMTYSLDMMVW